MASEYQTVGTEIRPGGFVGPFLGPNCLQSFQQTLVYGWNNKFSLIQIQLRRATYRLEFQNNNLRRGHEQSDFYQRCLSA